MEAIISVFLILLIILLMILISAWMVVKWKENEAKKENPTTSAEDEEKDPNAVTKKKTVQSFMEFEKIEDSMIITKKNRKYVMVIECQGINYDLMSEIEKNSVERGFIEFLNALRHPIQLYLQTRTINLNQSLLRYKERLKKYEQEYQQAEREYIQKSNDITATSKQILDAKLEYNRKRNVYEYSKDIIQNTERISQNKNVLTRKYYIIISQFIAESKDDKEDLAEKREEVFQDLYTKAQSLIRALAPCNVQGKILNSEELIELLYVAYNRDEFDTFGMDKAIQAGYDELYSTGQDVYQKRIKLLDKLIEEKAVERINDLAQLARTEQEREIQEREQNLNTYVNAMARTVLERNKQVLGQDITERVTEKLNEEENEEKEKKVAKKEKKNVQRKNKEGMKNVHKKDSKEGKRKQE